MTSPARGRGSLRLNLMAWLVVPVVAILAMSVWLSYGGALRQATLVMDRNLTASARIIAEQLQYLHGQISVTIPPSALELFASDSHDEVAYAVIGPTHDLIAGFPGLTAPKSLPPEFESHFFETMFPHRSDAGGDPAPAGGDADGDGHGDGHGRRDPESA